VESRRRKKTEIGKLALSFPVRGHRRIEDSTINCISTMNSLARVYLAAFGCNGYLTLLLDLDSTFALLIIYLYSSGSGVATPTLYTISSIIVALPSWKSSFFFTLFAHTSGSGSDTHVQRLQDDYQQRYNQDDVTGTLCGAILIVRSLEATCFS
jgi:hypothetical protein